MKKTLFAAITICTGLLLSCGGEDSNEASNANEAQENARYDLVLEDIVGDFDVLPALAESESNPVTDAKVRLGHKLYFDTQLSKEGNISCNSCHNLATFGVDNLPNSPGDAGENGDRNSPTVLNAALHASQFWDGRAKDVEEQAGMPVLNPIEMAIPNEAFLISRLKQDRGYLKMFTQAFPEDGNSLNYPNLRKAIAAFERKLITPSRFDDYLKGDKNALTVAEKKGFLTFAKIGCTTCHTGPALGGDLIQKFGVYKNYWESTGSANIDEGLANVTGNDIDKYSFKVPSLRNIEKTGPYFHDGSVKDLRKAVEIMADVQLDYQLSEEQKDNLIAFLGALTGSVPKNYQQAPVN